MGPIATAQEGPDDAAGPLGAAGVMVEDGEEDEGMDRDGGNGVGSRSPSRRR